MYSGENMSPTNSIRDAKALETIIQEVNGRINGHNFKVYQTEQGETVPPVEWGVGVS